MRFWVVILSCFLFVTRALAEIPTTQISPTFEVTADGVARDVHPVRIAPGDDKERWAAMDDAKHPDAHFAMAAFSTIDSDKPIDITVTTNAPIRSAKILPTSANVAFVIRDGRLTFTATPGQQLTIELDGNWVNSLHVFINPIDAYAPTQGDANTLYFGPGIHEVRDTIVIGSGQTAYLTDGAIMKAVGDQGPVFLLKGDHPALRGRGIIDGSATPRHTRNLVAVYDASNALVDGVTLNNSSTFNLPIRRSDHVTVKNVKIFGCRANSDGVDICNSRDVTVDHCFLRTLDDLVVVKSDKGQGPVKHVIVQNCVLWNQVAHALSIGAELREPVNDVVFRNCDVIHDKGREWTLRIYHCDSAPISNVRFEDIRVEESQKLISLWIDKAIWTREAERGHIDHVTFQNITATADPLHIDLHGFDADHAINGVTFDHVVVNGKAITPSDVHTDVFVRDISICP